ncbi:unnamed protein product [Urochloa decumbens]|uniref:F-box domain-containing protein n=1 Tax=Urochloa decumbens TaxID=240449 RepID=A0ABC8WKE6_9POAL
MPPPELSDDLVGEFLLRLPPDDPACLLRASLACKRWRRILADPAFLRRHRELHPAPSIVGFLRIVKAHVLPPLLETRCIWTHAFEFQLGARRLSIVDGPPPSLCQSFVISFMSMGDGELRSMDVEDEPSLCLRLWSREAAPYSDGVARWTRGRAIELETLLPDGALPVSRVPLAPARRIPSVILLGFAEGTDVIFVGTQTRGHRGAVYMVQLNAGRARKVFDKCTLVIPYTSFCIPVTDVASTSERAREGVSSA